MSIVGVPEGVVLEPIGESWVAFSPPSGQTTMLNNESAAFLEVLARGPQTLEQAIAAFAEDVGVSADAVDGFMRNAERELRAVGLIRHVHRASADRATAVAG